MRVTTHTPAQGKHGQVKVSMGRAATSMCKKSKYAFSKLLIRSFLWQHAFLAEALNTNTTLLEVVWGSNLNRV